MATCEGAHSEIKLVSTYLRVYMSEDESQQRVTELSNLTDKIKLAFLRRARGS